MGCQMLLTGKPDNDRILVDVAEDAHLGDVEALDLDMADTRFRDSRSEEGEGNGNQRRSSERDHWSSKLAVTSVERNRWSPCRRLQTHG